MSLTRQFFRELGPLFRMLEQPFGRTPAFYGPRHWNRFDPFQEIEVRPSIDVTEQGNKYVLDAELPGVNKGNIEIRVGDGGRSITIEGKVVEKNRNNQVSHDSVATVATDSTTVANKDQSIPLTTEREFSNNVQFTRTVWLPRPVNTENVSARLENGILTILAQKAEDKASTTIPIE